MEGRAYCRLVHVEQQKIGEPGVFYCTGGQCTQILKADELHSWTTRVRVKTAEACVKPALPKTLQVIGGQTAIVVSEDGDLLRVRAAAFGDKIFSVRRSFVEFLPPDAEVPAPAERLAPPEPQPELKRDRPDAAPTEPAGAKRRRNATGDGEDHGRGIPAPKPSGAAQAASPGMRSADSDRSPPRDVHSVKRQRSTAAPTSSESATEEIASAGLVAPPQPIPASTLDAEPMSPDELWRKILAGHRPGDLAVERRDELLEWAEARVAAGDPHEVVPSGCCELGTVRSKADRDINVEFSKYATLCQLIKTRTLTS